MEASRRGIAALTPNANDKKSIATTRIFSITTKTPKTPRRRRKYSHPRRMKTTTLLPMGPPGSRKAKQRSERLKANRVYSEGKPNENRAAKGKRVNCLMSTTLTTCTQAQAKTKWR